MRAMVEVVVGEGALDLQAARKILQSARIPISLDVRYIDQRGGRNFWQQIERYNGVALRSSWVFALADQESAPCAAGLIAAHLKKQRHPKLTVRVAERMLESWLLADVEGFAGWLGIPQNRVPARPDELDHAKRELVGLARRSKRVRLKADLVPEQGSSGLVGKGYAEAVTRYIGERWRPDRARRRSPSLDRAMKALAAVLEVEAHAKR